MINIDFNKIKEAVQEIADNKVSKKYIDKSCIIYKIPSKNPERNIIRIDIRCIK